MDSMETVFDRVCNELVPNLGSFERTGPALENARDGSVTAVYTSNGGELEVVFGENNAECVTVKWGEHEVIIHRVAAERVFSVRIRIGLRERNSLFWPFSTLETVFARVLLRCQSELPETGSI
jgi:hypothetical protein